MASKTGICTGDSLRRTVEASLTRLQTDRLDVLQIHGMSYSERDRRAVLERGGILEAMIRLKDEGLVRFIGFTSEDNNDAVYEFIRCGQFDMMQICYNLFMQHPFDPNRPFGSMLEAEKAGMGIAAMRTTTSGLFQRWMQAVHKENTFDYTPALIQYVLANPYVDVALVGMRSAEQVRKNAALCGGDAPGRVSLDDIFTYYV
ncbi:aldo/keto reductase [Paenibacillus humicola]|uniref:aldo/keto reductase n=1 Tax=Paenibacillus humicola TaxID=3110540 RepID=UPI00237B0911|nr:aldo/keto reductase [Paenibacillus humicola]